MNLTRTLSWPPLAALVLAIYWIALATATHVPKLPTVSLPRHGDKMVHYVAYSLLAFLLSWAWTTRRPYFPWGVVFAFGVATLYGAVDELTQIPAGRSAEWYDWCADSLGALTGIALFSALELLRRAVKRRT